MDFSQLDALLAQAEQLGDDLDALFRLAAQVDVVAPRRSVVPDAALATRAGLLRMIGERALAAGARMPRAPSASAPKKSPYCVLDDSVLEVFALGAFLRLRFAPEDPAARQGALPIVVELGQRAYDEPTQEALQRERSRLQTAEPWPRLKAISFGPHRVEAFPIGGKALVTVDGVYRRVLEGVRHEPPSATAMPDWNSLLPFFGRTTAGARDSLSVSERIDGNHFRQYTTRSTELSLTPEGLPKLAVSVAETDESYY